MVCRIIQRMKKFMVITMARQRMKIRLMKMDSHPNSLKAILMIGQMLTLAMELRWKHLVKKKLSMTLEKLSRMWLFRQRKRQYFYLMMKWIHSNSSQKHLKLMKHRHRQFRQIIHHLSYLRPQVQHAPQHKCRQHSFWMRMQSMLHCLLMKHYLISFSWTKMFARCSESN